MSDKLQIKSCPTCGSDKIRHVVRDITRKYKGQTYRMFCKAPGFRRGDVRNGFAYNIQRLAV